MSSSNQGIYTFAISTSRKKPAQAWLNLGGSYQFNLVVLPAGYASLAACETLTPALSQREREDDRRDLSST